MLEDRDYMRAPRGAGRSGSTPHVPAWLVIMVLNVAVFLVQNAFGQGMHHSFMEFGALSWEGLKRGCLWQFLTFQFMHGSVGHLAANSLGLYFFARPLEIMLGRRTFLSLYLLSGFVGGIVQILLGLVSDRFAGPMVGASAGLCGLVAAFALLNPESTIYLFFVLPIRSSYFLPLMIGVSLLFILLPNEGHIAHGAHLGGLLAGVAWVKLGWRRDFIPKPWETLFERVRRWKPLHSRHRKRELVRAATNRGRPWKPAAIEAESELAPEEFITKQVDPILDKISAHGIQSLTERDRRILEAARRKMAKP